MQDVIQNMKICIAKSGMKKKDVACKMGITEKKLSDILHGRKVIDAPVIRMFCRALQTTPNELFLQKDK